MEFIDDWSAAYVRTWSRCPALREFRPTRVLEIGVHEGRSAVYTINRMPPGGWFVGVDPFLSPEIEARARRNIAAAAQQAGVEAAILPRKFDGDVVSSIDTCGGFDLLYIDATKDRDELLALCRLAFPLVRLGGLMIFDDAYWHEDRRCIDLDRLSPAGHAIFEALADIGKSPWDFVWHESQVAVFR
jgi:predicted O-methyltransferase YrrM